jgi:hypothetical protein
MDRLARLARFAAGTASSSKRDAGGYAPYNPDAPQAAAAQMFAKRSRFEQDLFQTAASSSAEYRVAAFGREELHPPEEYLAVNFPRGGVQIFGSVAWSGLQLVAKNSGVEAVCSLQISSSPELFAFICNSDKATEPAGQALRVIAKKQTRPYATGSHSG